MANGKLKGNQGFTDQIIRLEDIVSYFSNVNMNTCTDQKNCYKAQDITLEANLKTDLYGIKPGKVLSKISSQLSPWPFGSVPPASYNTSGDTITATYNLPYKNSKGEEYTRTINVEIAGDNVKVKYKTSGYFKGNSILPFRKSIRKDANRILRGLKRATLWKRFYDYMADSC